MWRWRLLLAGKLVAAPLRTAMAALASLGLAGCDVGNGDELHDLRRGVRMAWGREHGAAVMVPEFAMAAAPRLPQVLPGTRAT